MDPRWLRARSVGSFLFRGRMACISFAVLHLLFAPLTWLPKIFTRTSDLALSAPWCCKRTFVDSPSLVSARYYSVAMVAFTHSQLFALSTFWLIASGFSTLRTCTDGSCARSNQTIDLLNSYRDTTCKPLDIVVGGSFQIVQLDPGCIGKYHRFLH